MYTSIVRGVYPGYLTMGNPRADSLLMSVHELLQEFIKMAAGYTLNDFRRGKECQHTDEGILIGLEKPD